MSEIARRLLWALVDEAMAEKQAEAAEDVVGASAGITAAVVAAARLPTAATTAMSYLRPLGN